jgi:hemerythrin-like metal-binding protein
MSSDLRWKDDYVSGFDIIDHAHKALLLQCGEMVAAAEDSAEAFHEALGHLFCMVIEHFHDEERLLGRIVGLTHAEQHREEHKMILRLLADGEAFEASRCTTVDSRTRLARMIEAWIIREISVGDQFVLGSLRKSI